MIKFFKKCKIILKNKLFMKLHLGVMSTLPDHSATLHIRSILCRFHNFKKLKNVKIKPTILVINPTLSPCPT